MKHLNTYENKSFNLKSLTSYKNESFNMKPMSSYITEYIVKKKLDKFIDSEDQYKYTPNTKEELISFIQMVQYFSPIDSNVTPVPWAMPGYNEEVIMAAGTFVAGASIELSADAPIKEPYIAYFQGGITYEHVKLALIGILDKLIN